MSEHKFQFSSIHVTKSNNPRERKAIPTSTLAFDRKTIYASSNYSLKLKDVTIDKSFHETRDPRGRKQRCLLLTLQNTKLKVEASIADPSDDTRYKFDEYVDNLEGARIRLTKKGKGKEFISMGSSSTNAGKKRINTITPARGLYMSPRKSPGRIRASSPLKQRGRELTRGNVVTTHKEERGMKLPVKSPRRATPSKKFVEPKHTEVKRSVFSQEEYMDEELEDSPVEEPKRKRLGKFKAAVDDEDSDVEFDAPTAKKKLRLGDDDEVPSPEDRGVWMGMNSGIEEGEAAAAEETESNESKEQENGSDEKEVETKEKEKKVETKPLFGIFAKHAAKPKDAPKSDTFGGAIMSSPKKSIKSAASTPPPSAPERAPALKQVPRTGVKSRYFDQVDKKKTSPTESDEMYETDEEKVFQDDGTPYYQSPMYESKKGSISESKDLPRKRDQSKVYGKSGVRNPYQNRSVVRSSRIERRSQLTTAPGTIHFRRHMQGVPREGLEETSPAKRLDFAFSSADRALNSSRKLIHPRFRSESSAKETEEPSKPIIPGIHNLGNTCYLSASLQTLFGIPDFLRDLYKMYDAEHAKKDMPLTKALLEVAVAIGVVPEEDMPKIDASAAKSKLTNSKAANPSALKKQMDVLTDKFVGYEQRDAHEFLSDLVDCLHEELVAEEKKEHKDEDGGDKDTAAGAAEEDKENDDSAPNSPKSDKKTSVGDEVKDASAPSQVPPTDDYFHLKVRVCLECDCCKYSRSKEELYRHLSIDVGEDIEDDPWTVKRGLEKFFQPETRELKCEKCSDGATATQTIEIISCPKALLLHFKRFIVTQEARAPSKSDKEDDAPPVMEMVLKKNKAKINLEDSLSIPIFATEAKYNLRGVVHHVGNTAFSGHYTACGLRSNADTDAQDNGEQWVYFDDRKGIKEDFDYVAKREKNQRNCYMALYELK